MNEISNVNFCAKPLHTADIYKWNKKTKTFKTYKAMFVRIDGNNKYDMEALDTVAKKWNRAGYVQQIVTAAHWMGEKKSSDIKVYALMHKVKNYDRIRHQNILGLVEIRNDGDFPRSKSIELLQVKPTARNVNNAEKKKYQHVGSAILESLEKEYSSLTVFSESDPSVKAFYERNGFVEDYFGDDHYFWSTNILKMAKLRAYNFALFCKNAPARFKMYYKQFIDYAGLNL